MKKIVLMMACAIATSSAFAQYVLGTKGDNDVNFMTNDLIRGKFVKTGAFVMGDNTDPDAGGYKSKMVLTSNSDLLVHNTGYIFLDNTSKIVGGPIASYSGSRPSLAALQSYIYLSHSSDGSMLLNSASSEIFLQPESGVVYVGEPYAHSLPTNHSSLDVKGSTNSDGYSANIIKVDDDYTLTNADYTVLVECTTAVTITPPTSGVEHGKIFVIKNIGTATVYVENVDGVASPGYVVSNPNSSVMIQLYLDTSVSPSTWKYYAIAEK